MYQIDGRDIYFAPSLMCMDVLNVQKQIQTLNKYADIYHIDIMDGHYVNNLAFSTDFCKKVKEISEIEVDCHLMVTNPSDYVDILLAYDIDYISIHAELLNGIAYRTFEKIKQNNKKVGVVLNPETNIETILSYIGLVDKITIMSVDPGFAGQTFVEDVLKKVVYLQEYKRKHDLGYLVEIDGSANKRNFKKMFDAGVDVFIVGASGLFDLTDDIELSWKTMIDNFNESVL